MAQQFVFELMEVSAERQREAGSFLRISVKSCSSIHSHSTHAPHNNLAAGYKATEDILDKNTLSHY